MGGKGKREIRRYDFEGRMMTVSEIAAATEITPSIISSRLFKGKRGAELREKPLSRAESARRSKAMQTARKKAGTGEVK